MADCPGESSRSSRLYDNNSPPTSASESQQHLVTMSSDMKDIPAEVRKLSTQQENADEVREAIELEHTLTFWEAAKLHPKAIGWSVYFSLGVIMLCKSIAFPR